ncbi:MAG: hypothetical protein FWG25_03810, partial [Promicromonosporaceae bacterium]|nr:hypothetical protein [Promicromonosporaceae bacterium]
MPPELPIISLRSDIDSFEDDERATHQRQRDAHLQRLGADTRQITPAGSDHLDIAYHRDHVAVIANEVAQLLERVRK